VQLRITFATAAGGTLLLAAVGCQATPSLDGLTTPYPAEDCPSCAVWNEPQQPLRLYGNTYYVGTRGLASLLITSADGHILIDGGLPDSAPLILDNIRALGFDVADVQLIVNSHAHFDHAGGIAALQRASGARVAAGEASAQGLETGRSRENDPQFRVHFDFPATGPVERFGDGETLRVGELAITAHLTPGHTPGGTTWSWSSCEDTRCLTLVYADSQTPISADGFRFSDNTTYPSAVDDFRRGFTVLERLPCDILITPHPGASSLWERLEGESDGLVDPDACRRYVARARQQLERRLEREAAGEL
jgi:metallo-beta-lactamase class B